MATEQPPKNDPELNPQRTTLAVKQDIQRGQQIQTEETRKLNQGKSPETLEQRNMGNPAQGVEDAHLEEAIGTADPDDIKQDELVTLKNRADMLGITYHPSIGVEKLRDKISAKMGEEVNENNGVPTTGAMIENADLMDEADDEDSEVKGKGNKKLSAESSISKSIDKEEKDARRARKKREANELVRVRVMCMNPNKKEYEGEIFTSGNSLVGSFTKYVPFNNDEGWHVPRIILNQILNRQCQVFTSVRDSKGNLTRRAKLIREFAVEEMPKLTARELKDLGQRQAMAKGQDK